eukprot:797354-Rhodomonas_salina.1
MTAVLQFAGVENYRKHIPSSFMLGRMKTEMRNISMLQGANSVSKGAASGVTLYHDGTTLGGGSEDCNHHIACQLGIAPANRGDEPQIFTFGTTPTPSGDSVDGAAAVDRQLNEIRRLVEMVEQGATAGDIQMSESLACIAANINIAMIVA